jgi:protease PrsW
MAEIVVRYAISVLPVILFLSALIFLDTYRIISFKAVFFAVVVGLTAAVASFFIGTFFLGRGWISIGGYARYVAPPLEETLKLGFVIYLMRTKRIGFMVDAAIYGFAIGTGFAIVENVYFLHTLASSNILVWIIRGFGTAVMHGGTTSLFGIITVGLSERRESAGAAILLPGFVVALFIHSAYNHFLLSPVVSAFVVVLALPFIMIWVFKLSERSLQEWLGVGFDSDAELLDVIVTGGISKTRVGRYLASLTRRFPGEAIADMLCLVRLHAELALKAKGILLMREAGFEVKPDPEVKEKFDEMRYLEKTIGATGRLAIEPILHWRGRDLWQLYMLGRK